MFREARQLTGSREDAPGAGTDKQWSIEKGRQVQGECCVTRGEGSVHDGIGI